MIFGSAAFAMDPEPAGVLLVGLVKLPGGLHYVLSAELLEFFGLLWHRGTNNAVVTA